MRKKLIILLSIVSVVIFFFSACKNTDNGKNELDIIKERGKLILLTNAEYIPFEFIGNEGKCEGIDIDIAEEIANDLGVSLEVVDMNFDFLIDSLKSQKGDIVMAAMTATPERKEQVTFSDPYISSAQYIVYKDNPPEDISNMSRYTIGVQQSTIGDFYATDVLQANVLRFNNVLDASQSIISDKCDFVLLDEYVARNIVETNNDILHIYNKKFNEQDFVIVVKKGRHELVNAINTTIGRLKNYGKLDQIIKKYINVR